MALPWRIKLSLLVGIKSFHECLANNELRLTHCIIKQGMEISRAVLIESSWSSSAQLREKLMQSARLSKEHMLVILNEHSSTLLSCGLPDLCEKIRDQDAIRSTLSKYDITTLPVLLLETSDGAEIVYPEDGAVPGESHSENADSLFRSALDAYESFDIPRSAELFHDVLKIDPTKESALFNLAGIMHMCDYPTLALGYIEKLLKLNPSDATAKSFLWSLASSDQGRSAGIVVYKRMLDSGDLTARHRLAQLTGDICLEADNEYLKDFYDRIAENFEDKLVVHLGYRGPWILFKMVNDAVNQELQLQRETSDGIEYRLSGIGQFRVFDLGCGSGLCGRVFGNYTSGSSLQEALDGPKVTVEDTLEALKGSRPSKSDITAEFAEFPPEGRVIVPIDELAGRITTAGPIMVGIDISRNMVAKASCPQNNYHLLTCGHLVDGLKAFNFEENNGIQIGEKLDLVIAADTFIYVGALGKVFSLISKALKPRGFLAFSTEVLNSSEEDCDMPILNPVECSCEGFSLDPDDEVLGLALGDGFKLLDSARFGHSVRYIELLCGFFGFTIVGREKHVLRTESSVPLPGMFYVLQRK